MRSKERQFLQTLLCAVRSNFHLPQQGKLISHSGLQKNLHTTNKDNLNAICRLDSRGVVQLTGKDTADFLQGFVTNDVNQLIEKSPAVQYCMMLNVQGRVLYDLFLYNITSSPTGTTTVLVDADKSVIADLINIFKKYKLRKKVDLSDVSDQYKIWTKFAGIEGSDKQHSDILSSNPLHFHDPRVPTFAIRIVSDNVTLESSSDRVTETVFAEQRYQWGISEGVADLPPGNCLPLESNLAFMNGVNFQKGCYIGQELTARTHHTGVIRKRLMPLVIEGSDEIEVNSTITTEEKSKTAGKFRNSVGKYGIGLLRLEYHQERLMVKSKKGQLVLMKTHIPKWWPNMTL